MGGQILPKAADRSRELHPGRCLRRSPGQIDVRDARCHRSMTRATVVVNRLPAPGSVTPLAVGVIPTTLALRGSCH